jgi:hypothetical protein
MYERGEVGRGSGLVNEARLEAHEADWVIVARQAASAAVKMV